MTYVRIDDHFPQHRKILGLDDSAFALYVRSICYCATQLSNGDVIMAALPLLTRHRKPQTLVAQLVEAELWEITLAGWRVHDYLDWQESADSVLGKRAAARERMQRLRSQDVRTNNERSSQEVREQAVDTKNREQKELEPRVKTLSEGRSAKPPDPDRPNGFVGFYVDECRARGYQPVAQWRAQIGNQSKRIATEKSPDLIRSAIRIMADERKAPGILAHVIADIEAGRNGNGQSA